MGLQREDWGSRQGDEICDIMCVCWLLVLPGRDVTQPGDRHYSQLVKTAHFLVLFLGPTTLRDKLEGVSKALHLLCCSDILLQTNLVTIKPLYENHRVL